VTAYCPDQHIACSNDTEVTIQAGISMLTMRWRENAFIPAVDNVELNNTKGLT